MFIKRPLESKRSVDFENDRVPPLKWSQSSGNQDKEGEFVH